MTAQVDGSDSAPNDDDDPFFGFMHSWRLEAQTPTLPPDPDPFFGFVHSWRQETPPMPMLPPDATTPTPCGVESDVATEIDSASSVSETIPDAEAILQDASLHEHIAVFSCTFGEPCVATVVQLVESFISKFQPACFKIGITGDPGHRFYNSEWGYASDGYGAMTVLHLGSPAQGCALERALINVFWQRQGFQNERPGGENPPDDYCFTYCVAAWAPRGSLLRAARQKRRMK